MEETGTLAQIKEKLDLHIVEWKEHKSLIEKAILGNGSKDYPGLLTRVSLIEQKEETERWYFRSIWTAILGLATSVIIFFTKNTPQ